MSLTRRTVLAAATAALVAGSGLVARPAAAAPAVPAGVSAALVAGPPGQPSVVRVSWTDGAREIGYRVERCYGPACTDFGQIATVAAGVTSWDDSFVASATTARFRVRSIGAKGVSEPSEVASATVFGSGDVTARVSATPVSGVAPLTVVADGSGSTALNGSVTGWTWAFGDGDGAAGSTTTHTYTTPGVYALTLQAQSTGIGTTRDSAQVVVTVTAPPVLVAPTGLAGSSPAVGQASLTWANPATTTATSLSVQRCIGTGCTAFRTVATGDPGVSAFTNFGLRSRTVYRFRVVVTDGTRTLSTAPVPVWVR